MRAKAAPGAAITCDRGVVEGHELRCAGLGHRGHGAGRVVAIGCERCGKGAACPPSWLQVGSDLHVHLGAQHEPTQPGGDVLEQVGGQQCVHGFRGLAQPQHGDDAPLRVVAGRKQRAAVAEQLRVVGDLALETSRRRVRGSG